MTIISGRYGQVAFGTQQKSLPTEAAKSITSWSMDYQMPAISYIASNTRGYNGKLKGVAAVTGNISGIGAIPPIKPGGRFYFYGFCGPRDVGENWKWGDSTPVGKLYSIAALVNSVGLSINYQRTNPITWTVGWQSDWQEAGDGLQHTDGVMWDTSAPDIANYMPSETQNVDIGTNSGICLVDSNLQFNTDVATFSDSCTAVDGGWQRCVVGPTNCTLSANVHGDFYGDVGDLGDDFNVKLYTNGGFFEFNKMMLTQFGGLNVDVTTNNPLQFGCQMEFNAWPSGSPGYIEYKKYKTNVDGTTDSEIVQEVATWVDMRGNAQSNASDEWGRIGKDNAD